jgi:hypothetical protein
MFSYFNPSTVERGISERWEVYAKKLSGGELFSLLSSDERLRCTNCPDSDRFPAVFLADEPNVSSRLDYWEVVRFPNTKTSVDRNANCNSVIAEVQRPYLWYTFPVTRASSCDIKAGSLDTLLENPDDVAKWWRQASQWGWEKSTPTGVTSQPGVPSALAWSTEPIAAGTTRSYVLDLSVLEGSADFVTVSVVVNGIAMDDFAIAARGKTDLVIDVPSPSIEGAPDDLVVVEFVLTDGAGSPVSNSLVVSAIRTVL